MVVSQPALSKPSANRTVQIFCLIRLAGHCLVGHRHNKQSDTQLLQQSRWLSLPRNDFCKCSSALFKYLETGWIPERTAIPRDRFLQHLSTVRKYPEPTRCSASATITQTRNLSQKLVPGVRPNTLLLVLKWISQGSHYMPSKTECRPSTYHTASSHGLAADISPQSALRFTNLCTQKILL